MFVRVLEEAGARVVSATSVEEGMALLRAERPDVIPVEHPIRPVGVAKRDRGHRNQPCGGRDQKSCCRCDAHNECRTRRMRFD